MTASLVRRVSANLKTACTVVQGTLSTILTVALLTACNTSSGSSDVPDGAVTDGASPDKMSDIELAIEAAQNAETEVDLSLSRRLYNIDPIGMPSLNDKIDAELNPCLQIHSANALRKIDDNVFNVIDFGAKGTSVSAPIPILDAVELCSECSEVAKLAVALLESKLTFDRKDFLELPPNGDASKERLVQGRPPGFNQDDEWDWIAIQSAIEYAASVGGGTIILPDTGTDYLLNRPLWMKSNVRLIWLTDESKAQHSYLRMTSPSIVTGSFIASYNEWLRDRYLIVGETEDEILLNKKKHNFLCRVRLHSPRLKTLPGENAIAMAIGAYDVQIYNGHITGARFAGQQGWEQGYRPQGGKAIQFEEGVMQAIVEGTRITDSSIGLNLSSGRKFTIEGSHAVFENAVSDVYVSELEFDEVEAPIAVNGGRSAALIGTPSQIAKTEEFEKVAISTNVRIGSITVRNLQRWRDTSGSGIDVDPAELSATGVINFKDARHVVVEGINHVQSSGLSESTLIQGNGKDISVSGFTVNVPFTFLHMGYPIKRQGSRPAAHGLDLALSTATNLKTAVRLQAKEANSLDDTFILDVNLNIPATDVPYVDIAGSTENFRQVELDAISILTGE